MMDTITLKYTASSVEYTQNFDVIAIWKDYFKEETKYDELDWTKGKIVHAVYDRWNVHFGHLTEAQQNFLIQWELHEVESTTKMTYNSTDYGPLIIQKLTIKPHNGVLIFILQEPNP